MLATLPAHLQRAAHGTASVHCLNSPERVPPACLLLPRVAVEDIDAHIAELEHRISHDSLSLNEEKKVLEQIKALKKSRGYAERGVSCRADWPRCLAAQCGHLRVQHARWYRI